MALTFSEGKGLLAGAGHDWVSGARRGGVPVCGEVADADRGADDKAGGGRTTATASDRTAADAGDADKDAAAGDTEAVAGDTAADAGDAAS